MYVNVVFAAVAIAGALAILREPAARTRPRLDTASVITVSAGLFALVYGFSHAETAGWTSPVTLGALAAGAALLAVFAGLQAKVASPLLPLRILADRARVGAYLAIFTVGISIFGMLLFVTYYLQQSLRFSAIEAGLAFLPMTFALAIAAQLSIRRIVPKVGPRAAITPGLLLAAAGAFLLTRLGVSSDYASLVLPATLLFGAGLGMVVSASIATATAGITPADSGAASALMTYAVIDIGQLMTAAGHAVRCVEYLLGNHVTAERMFRHDPAVALYAPLRVVIHSDPGDQAIITLDQPSGAFAGLGNPEVTAVGTELDHTVAELLRVITGRAPQALLQPGHAAIRAK